MATGGTTVETAAGEVGVANGPEGGILDWHAVDWRRAEDDVRRLRRRIFFFAGLA
jgi:RNA-directed DNA polymerase